MLLTLFFGPLGMLYATIPGALVMGFFTAFLLLLVVIFPPFILFVLFLYPFVLLPIALVWAGVSASRADRYHGGVASVEPPAGQLGALGRGPPAAASSIRLPAATHPCPVSAAVSRPARTTALAGLGTVLAVTLGFVWYGSRDRPHPEGVAASVEPALSLVPSTPTDAYQPLERQPEAKTVSAPQKFEPPVQAAAVEANTKRGPTRRPRAPDGFEAFQLGMTRRAVHGVVGGWPGGRVIARAWDDLPAVTGVPYKGIRALAFEFSDGAGLSVLRGHLTAVRDLPPDAAEARLRTLLVEFEEQHGPAAPFLETLHDTYGPTSTNEPPTSADHRYAAFHSAAKGETRPYVWWWKDADRTVVAAARSRPKPLLFPLVAREGTPETFALHLLFVDGLCTRADVHDVLRSARERRERERALAALETLRAGVGDHIVRQTGPSGQPAATSAVLPDALCGTWHVRARKPASRWEGLLTIEKDSKSAEATGRLEWLEGEALGELRGAVTVCRSERVGTPIMIFQPTVEQNTLGNLFPGIYAAAVGSDGRTLLSGECEQPGKFPWDARRVSEGATSLNRQRKASVAGTWQLLGGSEGDYRTDFSPRWSASCMLLEGATSQPLRRIVGWYSTGGRTFRLMGAFTPATGRLWFRRLSGEAWSTDYVYDAFLSEDGTRLAGGRFAPALQELDASPGPWKAIRDELIPKPRTWWSLSFPWEVGFFRPSAARFLDGVLDAFEIDLAVPGDRAGEYVVLGRKAADGRRSVTRITERPKGVTWQLNGNLNQETVKAFKAVLHPYSLCDSRNATLILPPQLTEHLQRLEQAYLQQNPHYQTQDPRRIQETAFTLSYDERNRQVRFQVRSMKVSEFLSW
jgi:hypothetical protein